MGNSAGSASGSEPDGRRLLATTRIWIASLLGVRLRPLPPDGKLRGVGAGGRARRPALARDDQDLDRLPPQVGEPGGVVGVETIPGGPGIGPGRLTPFAREPMIVVHQPAWMR